MIAKDGVDYRERLSCAWYLTTIMVGEKEATYMIWYIISEDFIL